MALAKNQRGSRKHLLGNIGEKIGKNWQTTASIKKCKFCTSIGSKFAYRFFPYFPIFRDVRFFEKITIFSGQKIGSQKKMAIFRDIAEKSAIFSTMLQIWLSFVPTKYCTGPNMKLLCTLLVLFSKTKL